MQLETFINETICGIVRGVVGAQVALRGSGAAVVPHLEYAPNRSDATAVQANGKQSYAYEVDFDVAVVVSAEREAGAKASVSVLGLDLLGASGATANSESRTSRIRFKVPVMFPPEGSPAPRTDDYYLSFQR